MSHIKAISKHMFFRRIELGYTRIMLAEMTGLHLNTIAGIEGRVFQTTTIDTLVLLANALGVGVDDLLRPYVPPHARRKRT